MENHHRALGDRLQSVSARCVFSRIRVGVFFNKLLGSNGDSGLELKNSSPTPCGLCVIAPTLSYVALDSGAAVSTGLSVSGPTFASKGIVSGFPGTAQVTLAGSIAVTASGTTMINDVETILMSCFPSITPQACVTGTNTQGEGLFLYELVFLFTQKTLDGLGGDPSPVPVTAGQVIGITVTLTFQ